MTDKVIENLTKRVELLENAYNNYNNKVKVPIEFINDQDKFPVYANPTDAGADIFSNEDMIISPTDTRLIHTGIKLAIPDGFELQVRPRSGLSLKTNIRVANAPGTIDSGYRGELGIILYRDCSEITHSKSKTHILCDLEGNTVELSELSDKLTNRRVIPNNSILIRKGDRIAQVVLNKIYHADFIKVDDVSKIGTDRMGGFGHSGVSSNEVVKEEVSHMNKLNVFISRDIKSSKDLEDSELVSNLVTEALKSSGKYKGRKISIFNDKYVPEDDDLVDLVNELDAISKSDLVVFVNSSYKYSRRCRSEYNMCKEYGIDCIHIIFPS